MTEMLECLVSYFGIDENDKPTYGRYFCYQLVAGPGPADGAGVAVVTTLAVHDEAERCTSCQKFHAVEAGGAEAAIAAAVRYLDSYHEQDHVLKVQSDIRGLSETEKQGPGETAKEHAFIAESSLQFPARTLPHLWREGRKSGNIPTRKR
jgi:hypothetical protein